MKIIASLICMCLFAVVAIGMLLTYVLKQYLNDTK